jgi:hypothetical protein
MDRADDAKARLIALHQPVPKPTKAAVAQNKAEEDSRKSPSTLSKLMRNFEKHPSVADAARVGEPTLVDPTPMSASDVVQQAAKAMGPIKGGSDSHSVTVEVGKGAPPANQPVPRSDVPAATDTATTPDTSALGAPATSAAVPDQNELKPNVGSSDANELKPNVPGEGAQALPPPQQVNEIQAAGQQSGNPAVAGDSGQSSDSAASSSSQQTADDANVASSKRKKKKGIHKIVPF